MDSWLDDFREEAATGALLFLEVFYSKSMEAAGIE